MRPDFYSFISKQNIMNMKKNDMVIISVQVKQRGLQRVVHEEEPSSR